MRRIQFIDSHTGGEPTRVVVSGGPELGSGSLAERLRIFRERHDAFRRGVVNEPRGSDVLVGALLCEPCEPSCAAGVIFFDNVTFLGMCGHGTIGLAATLAHQGRIGPGSHRIETPVGIVTAELHTDGAVSVTNIPSCRQAAKAKLQLGDGRQVTGDVASGGNGFFITADHALDLDARNAETLTAFAWQLRLAANAQGFPEVDHIILQGPPKTAGASARNFVLCPGKAYDRSPCGTGTSAILACLAADGLLAEGADWVQESVIGSRFTGRYRWLDRGKGIIEPTITGRAFITGEGSLVFDPGDPFRDGIG